MNGMRRDDDHRWSAESAVNNADDLAEFTSASETAVPQLALARGAVPSSRWPAPLAQLLLACSVMLRCG